MRYDVHWEDCPRNIHLAPVPTSPTISYDLYVVEDADHYKYVYHKQFHFIALLSDISDYHVIL